MPFIGSAYILSNDYPLEMLEWLQSKYGAYVGIVAGPLRIIVVNGYEAISEFLLNEDFLGRPDVCLTRDRFDGERYGE